VPRQRKKQIALNPPPLSLPGLSGQPIFWVKENWVARMKRAMTKLVELKTSLETFPSDAGECLSASGYAVMEKALTPAQCTALIKLYDDDKNFRSRVVMARHGYGKGEYKYFAYPLPPLISELRTDLYAPLAAIANAWMESIKSDVRYPPTHKAFLKRCHDAGQARPTPLLLRYGAGDYNCLHQDLYGEHVFPLQIAFLLSEPGRDFEGGEFVLTEQRPRMQSRAEVVPLRQGDAVIFAVNERPVQGAKGIYRVKMRHGVSRLCSGHRHTLGIIFHDAK
jgi:hypothetical protein